jgi:hypothetical protein
MEYMVSMRSFWSYSLSSYWIEMLDSFLIPRLVWYRKERKGELIWHFAPNKIISSFRNREKLSYYYIGAF